MPTNEERQRVADSLRIFASYREVDKELVEDALGLYMGECVDGYYLVSVVHVANLIEPEPTVDRDALLMLADDLAASYPWDIEEALSTMEEIAQLIREACGVIEE